MTQLYCPTRKLRCAIAACLAVMICLASIGTSTSAAQDEKDSLADQITQLETELFKRTLEEAELVQMLEQLTDSKTRKDHAWVIAKSAAGCQESIANYANQCSDIHIREICADIVSYLDDGWRKTGRGKQYLTLCKAAANSEAGFKKAWDRFLVDSTDQAAFEKVLAAPTEAAWKWIETIQSNKEARNGATKRSRAVKSGHANYLLLRVREMSPDSFAAKRLGELDIKALPTHLFPARKIGGAGDSYRQVGHVLLKRVEWKTPKFEYHTRSDLYSFYAKQYLLFRTDSGSKQIGKGRLVQSVYFDSTTYGPYYRDKNLKRIPLTKKELASPMFTRREESSSIVIPNRTSPPMVPIINASAGDRQNFKYHPMLPPNTGVVPWWWRHFVSEANAEKMAFLKRERGAKVPGVFSDKEIVGIAPTGEANNAPVAKDSAPSFVFLPPRLEIRSEPHQIAAELAIDRCAEELQLLSVQIVNRKNLKRILEERQRNGSTAPMTSFDAMVRLKVSNDQLKPDATLSVIDLSTGSPLQESTFDWPIQEDQVKNIRTLLERSITSIKRPNKKQVKVRYLGTREPVQLRLRPMAIELTEAIDESLRENKLIQVVDHIESASAAEEAIFLAMGLTRNSGGRDFSPESDVTLEMSIDERDASGKIFANATLDIRTTLEVTGEAPQVATQSNRVGEFNSKLVPGVRSEILAGLRAIESGKKTSAAAKPGARRAQADRELDLIKMIDRKLPQFERTTLKFNLAHSALKLDPTYWRAALSVATANAGVYREDETRTDRHRLVLEAMKIVTDRAGDASLDQEAINSFNLTASNLLTILVDSEKAQRRIDSLKAAKKARPSRKISISEQQLSDAKLSEMVDTNLKRKICMAASLYLEQELKSPLIDMRTSFRFSKRSLQNAILGLKQTGSSPDELRPQIKRMIASLERLQSEHDEFIAGPSELDFHRRRQQNEYGYRVINEVRTSLMGVVCECQLTEEYDRLLPQLKKDLMRGKPIPWMIELQRKAIEPLGDPKRMASLESWIKDQGMEYGKKPTVRKTKTRDLQLAVIQFPKINVFANSRSRIVPAEDFEIDLPETHQIIPLTHTSNRLFFLASDALRLGWKSLTIIDRNAFSSRMKFGYIPISKDGNATGPAKFFELPSELQGQVIHGCVANENSLVLGTQANFRDKNIAGLYYLDISKNKWKYFGVEEGLPCQWITSIKSISNDRAICTGSMRPEIRQGERYSTYSRDSTFSFDLRTQKIRQLGLEAPNERGRVPGKLYCVYENRGIVYGQSQFFLWGDLLSSHPQKLLLKPQSKLDKLQYANVQDSVRMQDSLFFANSRGLHQMGLDGKDRRSWKSTSAYNNISPLTRIDFKPTQNAPPQSPLPWFPNLIATDDLLLMVDGMGMQMVGYDPKKEMWYGPIDVPKIIHGISGGSHIWVGGKSLRRMAVADIVTAAKQSDRVMTVKQFAERQQKLISSMTGLGRAKIEFSMLRFEESKTFLEKILERTPDDVETHLMLGILHDTWGLNDLEKASKSYQRAEELSKENRSMGLAAAKLHLDLLKRHEKFDRATKIAEKLLKDYPDTSNLFRQRIQDDGSRKR